MHTLDMVKAVLEFKSQRYGQRIKDWLSVDPLDNPLRFDESKAPLAARSSLSLNKRGEPRWFELGNPDYTKRQIADNDYLLYLSPELPSWETFGL